MQLLRSIILFVLLVISSLELTAQYPGAGGRLGGNRPTQADTAGTNIAGPDTTIYNLFSMYDVATKIPFADTTLEKFHLYDPVRRGPIFAADLGNLGSSARQLLYDVPYQRGVNFGYDNYTLYRLEREDVKWYEVNRPFSDFYFSPGSSQQNFIIKAKFSRTFADSVSFHLDYQRISQEGFYNDQQAKSTYMATGIRILRDKTDTYILGMFNANNEAHNGGVANKMLLDSTGFNFRQRIPTYLEGANTRNNNVDVSINNYYHFKDSLTNDVGLSLRHEFALEGGAFKFYDESEADFLNYQPFANDNRGLRNRTGYFHLENGIYGLVNRKSLKVQAGIVYDFFNIKQEPRQYKKHNLFVKGDGSLTVFEKAKLEFKGHLGLADNAGDLWLQGDLGLDLSKLGFVQGGLKVYRYEPTILQQEVFFNGSQVWENNYPKLNGTGFYAKYHNPSLGLEVMASVDAIDNAIYFGTEKRPEIKDGAFTSSRLLVTEKIKLGPLHFHNTVGLQSFNDNIYNLPSWLSEHSLFIQGKIFKKRMNARLGFDLRLMESYAPAAFAPELGVFYQQFDLTEDLFRILDSYISFKIQSFRVFARFENLNHLIFNEVNYLTPNYPQFDFKFRLGAAWHIKD